MISHLGYWVWGGDYSKARRTVLETRKMVENFGYSKKKHLTQTLTKLTPLYSILVVCLGLAPLILCEESQFVTHFILQRSIFDKGNLHDMRILLLKLTDLPPPNYWWVYNIIQQASNFVESTFVDSSQTQESCSLYSRRFIQRHKTVVIIMYILLE